MQLPKLNKLLYGTDAAEKIEKLMNGLYSIENDNIKYFEARGEKLHDNYIIMTNFHGLNCNFLPESDLDESIRLKCLKLVDDIFKDSTTN
ncbi:MAG: hypothetical protein WCY89_07630 [Flavobacteriaceae bacterium]